MANVQHSSLTGADLHEPKGTAAATADQVYFADGAGSGSHANIDSTKIFDEGSNYANTPLVADGSGGSRWDGQGYEDITFSGYALGKGANAPTLTNYRDGIDAIAFSGSSLNEAFFTAHLPHNFKQGQSPTFHVHWSHNTASPVGDVKWNVEYTVARGYGVETFGTTTTVSTTQTAPAQYVHQITPDDDLTIPASASLEPDTLVWGRIFRDPTDAADTFTGDAFFHQLDIHYQVHQLTTSERNRPFTSAGF